MKRYIISIIVALILTAGIGGFAYWTWGAAKPSTTVVSTTVVEQRIPSFEVVSYTVRGLKIQTLTEAGKVAGFIPDGYQVSYTYEYIAKIGSVKPIVPTLNGNVLTVVLPQLEVIAIEKREPRLLSATTSGWRYFRGGGIPIQKMLDDTFDIDAIRDSILEDEAIMTDAQNALVDNVKAFYSVFDKELLIEL
jgi:hypothetical protein